MTSDLFFLGFVGANTQGPPPWWLFVMPFGIFAILILVAWISPVPGWREYQKLGEKVARVASPEAILHKAIIQSASRAGISCSVAIGERGLEISPVFHYLLANGRLFIPWEDLSYVGREKFLLQKRDYFAVERNGQAFFRLSFSLWREDTVQKRIRSRIAGGTAAKIAALQ